MTPEERKVYLEMDARILVRVIAHTDELSEGQATKILREREGGALPCGHHTSLLIRSTESDYQFCELCEMRSERNDAVAMEERLGARVRELEEDAARLNYLDTLNAAANERAGSRYGWRLEINHNRVALMDHNHPKLSVRQAIDEHREARRRRLDDPLGLYKARADNKEPI